MSLNDFVKVEKQSEAAETADMASEFRAINKTFYTTNDALKPI